MIRKYLAALARFSDEDLQAALGEGMEVDGPPGVGRGRGELREGDRREGRRERGGERIVGDGEPAEVMEEAYEEDDDIPLADIVARGGYRGE